MDCEQDLLQAGPKELVKEEALAFLQCLAKCRCWDFTVSLLILKLVGLLFPEELKAAEHSKLSFGKAVRRTWKA